MPFQTLNTATVATDLRVGHNITTADMLIGDNVTIGDISVGSAQTSGSLALGFSNTRTGPVTVGHQSSTGDVSLRTLTGDIGIGVEQTSGTLSLGTSASRTGDIIIGDNTNTGNISMDTTTGNITVGANQTSGTISIGTSEDRTGDISIGSSDNNGTIYALGNNLNASGFTSTILGAYSESINIGSEQSSGTIDIGTDSVRTGAITIGSANNSGNIELISTGIVDVGGVDGSVVISDSPTNNNFITMGHVLKPGNIRIRTAGELEMGSTSSSIVLGGSQTNGTINIGAGSIRTGVIAIGSTVNSGNINLLTSGDIALGGTTATDITIGSNQTTGVTNISTSQLNGSLNIGTSSSRSGTITIGNSSGTHLTYLDGQNVYVGQDSTSSNVGDDNTTCRFGRRCTGTITIGQESSDATCNIMNHTSNANAINIGNASRSGGINVLTTGDIVLGTSGNETQVAGQLTCTGKGTALQTPAVTSGVILNTAQGIIATVGLTIASHSNAVFTVSNNKCLSSSLILLTSQYSGSGSLHVSTRTIADGAFDIQLSNTGGVILDAFARIHFIIL